MDAQTHGLPALFLQLGLDNSPSAIDSFIQDNSPLAAHYRLYQAPFWNISQATFLQEAEAEDADWVDCVNHLDALLRH